MLNPDDPLSVFTTMTKRDLLAAIAMQGRIASGDIDWEHTNNGEWAYDIAEGMIKASERYAD